MHFAPCSWLTWPLVHFRNVPPDGAAFLALDAPFLLFENDKKKLAIRPRRKYGGCWRDVDPLHPLSAGNYLFVKRLQAANNIVTRGWGIVGQLGPSRARLHGHLGRKLQIC